MTDPTIPVMTSEDMGQFTRSLDKFNDAIGRAWRLSLGRRHRSGRIGRRYRRHCREVAHWSARYRRILDQAHHQRRLYHMTRIAFVDDDPETVNQLKRLVSGLDHSDGLGPASSKGIEARFFESAMEAVEWKADWYILDVSSVSPHPSFSWSAVCSMIERRPDARFAIASSFGRGIVQDLIEEIEQHSGATLFYLSLHDGFRGLERLIDSPPPAPK